MSNTNTPAWKFNDPPNVAVIARKSIFTHGDVIVYVTHDSDDGCWQFHTAQPEAMDINDACLVSFQSIVEHDPTIEQLAALPLGWCASRSSVDQGWEMGPLAE